ncbi:MAG: APC family permease [Candidatus Aenigmatarchaeota archaeon]
MPELKKTLNLWQVCFYGVGLILGAGIYAVIGEAAGLTGGSLPFAFLAAALIASLTGLSYAELSSLYPKAEGDYIYVKSAFENKILSDTAALFRIFVGVVSAAAVALAFGGYLASFVELPIIAIAIGLILIMTAINYYGIDFSSKVNIIFTIIEMAGLVMIIWIGLGSWPSAEVMSFPHGMTGLLESSFLIFFAYIGFESIVNLAEETEDASNKIPQAVIISIVITTVLYVLVAISSIALVDWQILGQSTSPLAKVALEGWGAQAFTLISGIALFSTTNTVLIILISTSRILYGVSKEKYHTFPEFFSKVDPRTNTPYISVIFICILTCLFTLIDDVGIVAGLSNLFLLMVFIMVNASLIKLRYKKPDSDRGFKAPGNIGNFSVTALLGLITCFGFVVFYLIQNLL